MDLPETRPAYLQTYLQMFRKVFFNNVHKNCSWEIYTVRKFHKMSALSVKNFALDENPLVGF